MIKVAQDTAKKLVAIHGISGISLGLLLYAVLVTGAVAVLAEEIGHWSVGLTVDGNPLHSVALLPNEQSHQQLLQNVIDELAVDVDPQYHEEIALYRSARGHLVVFFHKHQTNEDGVVEEIGTQFEVKLADGGVGEVLHRRHGTNLELYYSNPEYSLSRFLVSVHTELHLPRPWGLILTGILGLAMMVAAISGLILHRHLLKDAFTLRKGGNRVLEVKDAHTVAGSWGLPFAFVLAFTGSFFSFAGSIGLPAMAMVGFGGNEELMFETIFGSAAAEDATIVPSQAVDSMLQDAYQRTNALPSFVNIEHMGRADATVNVYLNEAEGELLRDTLVYSGANGEFTKTIPVVGQVPSMGADLYGLMAPLHYGHFMGQLSKFVWLALGIAMCYVTLTGMDMWLERRAEQAWVKLRWSVAYIGMGLPLALLCSAVAFVLSYPAGDPVFWTPTAFVLCSAILLMAAVVWRIKGRTIQAFKHVLLIVAGITSLILPLLRIGFGGPSWLQSIAAGQPTIVTVDLLLVCCGVIALWLVYKRRQVSLSARTMIGATGDSAG